MEKPSPVAEKWAVMPLTVRSMGSEVWMGAFSKSNRTGCARADVNGNIALSKMNAILVFIGFNMGQKPFPPLVMSVCQLNFVNPQFLAGGEQKVVFVGS